MDFPFGETVTILDGTAIGQDSDGNDTAAYPVKATYTNVAVAPADSNGSGTNEYTDGRDTVIIGLTIYLPDGADVASSDRAVCRGVTWEVAGLAQPYRSPFTGWSPGMAVSLRRVTG